MIYYICSFLPFSSIDLNLLINILIHTKNNLWAGQEYDKYIGQKISLVLAKYTLTSNKRHHDPISISAHFVILIPNWISMGLTYLYRQIPKNDTRTYTQEAYTYYIPLIRFRNLDITVAIKLWILRITTKKLLNTSTWNCRNVIY